MKLLLHVCCGPCAAYVANELAHEHEVKLFFYNPNVWPPEEYERRLEAARRLAKAAGLDIVVGEYEDSAWTEAVRGLEQEREGGRRCAVCFEFRLRKTAQHAAAAGCEAFATTLGVSPHKDAGAINRIGLALAAKQGECAHKAHSRPLQFIESDFKKHDGFRKSIDACRKLGLYRQKYCGCRYSLPTVVARSRANQREHPPR